MTHHPTTRRVISDTKQQKQLQTWARLQIADIF